MNIYPYVYRIDHPSGEFYIGYRVANQVPAEQDLGIKYKTSTKHLSYPFEEYNIAIVAEFFTDTAKSDAYDFEQALIYEHWSNPCMANKSCYYGSKARFRNPGGKPHTQEHKSALRQAAVGKVLSEEHKEKIRQAHLKRNRG